MKVFMWVNSVFTWWCVCVFPVTKVEVQCYLNHSLDNRHYYCYYYNCINYVLRQPVTNTLNKVPTNMPLIPVPPREPKHKNTYRFVEHALLSVFVLTIRTIYEAVTQHVVINAAVASHPVWWGAREPLHLIFRSGTVWGGREEGRAVLVLLVGTGEWVGWKDKLVHCLSRKRRRHWGRKDKDGTDV